MRLLSILFVLALACAALALQPISRSALETAPTFVDQTGTGYELDNRVVDSRDGHLQCVSQLAEGPFPGTPEAAARAFLARHRDWVGVLPSTDNLAAVQTTHSPMGSHVTFERTIGGLPVYPGELVVTLDKQSIVRFYFSSLIAVPENLSTAVALSSEQAVAIALNYLKPALPPKDAPQTRLVIWAGDNRDIAVCWRVNQFLDTPRGDWEVLVDASSGAIRRVKDRICYLNGTGSIFKPDPLTTAQVAYGTTGYSDGNDASTAQLQSQIRIDTLFDITLSSGVYRLEGPFCRITDWDTPTSAPVTATHPDSFRFNRQQQGFEDVNVYFHISTAQRWIQSLGFNDVQNQPMQIDAHGVQGDDNSYFTVSGGGRCSFGEGGVDDAEDADVIWHEYGHAMQFGINSNWGGGDKGAMGEGFGDYWAASYSRLLSDYRATWVYNWDGHNSFWDGRTLNANKHYPQNLSGEVHDDGEIWSQPCYEARLDLGRPVMDQLVIQHHFLIGSSATMPAAAQALLTADESLNGGVNHWALYARFVPRGLLSNPPAFALLSPVSGGLVPIDSAITVAWSPGLLTAGIRIDLSRTGAAGPWTTLVPSTDNDGRESVVIPGPATTNARIRIVSLGTPAYSDSSDNSFAVAEIHVYEREDFDNGADGWIHQTPGIAWADQWHLSIERALSGGFSYKCGNTGTGNYGTRCDSRLLSPIYTVPPLGMLEYWQQIEAETVMSMPDSANDGGILELSIDGGNFTQVFPSQNGYNCTIRSATIPTGPFPAGTQLFSGSTTTWTKVGLNLAPWAGHVVQLSFRFGSNTTVGGEGWYVDGVQIYGRPNVAPGSFARLTPLDNSQTSSDTVRFAWSAAADTDSDPVRYRFRLGSETYPTAWDTVTADTNFTAILPLASLDELLEFHWSVIATDGYDSTAATNGSGVFNADVSAVGSQPQIVNNYSLTSYPNPFNPTTTLAFSLPQPGAAVLAVFDVTGREVFRRDFSYLPAGAHTLQLDASRWASGLYLARLEAGPAQRTAKLLLVR